jgi:aspartate dehydrogenase
MQQAAPARTTVGIAGLGTVGRVVARHVAGMDGYQLTAVSARDLDRAKTFLAEHALDATIVPLERLAEHADIVIECAPAEHFGAIAEPVVAGGGTLIPLSVGALLNHWTLVDEAARTGARILVPTGALVGLDAVQAAAVDTIHSVRMTTRKPIASLENSDFVKQNGIDLNALDGPTLLFSGTAREAIVGFPANLNVLVALSLAGVGPDRTTIEVWADPELTLNTHRIELDSDSVKLDLDIRNIPSDDNPATGRLTALSVVALLEKLTNPLRIGT